MSRGQTHGAEPPVSLPILLLAVEVNLKWALNKLSEVSLFRPPLPLCFVVFYPS